MTNLELEYRLQYNVAGKIFPASTQRRGPSVTQCLQGAVFGFAALMFAPTHADPSVHYSNVDHSNLEIVTSALGLERLTEYSANRNALGIAWAKHFGMEASYFNLGESKLVKNRATNSDNVGGRVNVKLALDLSAPLSERSRLYGRVGVYLWEVDVNYNRATNELDASREGDSRMVGVGAVYGTNPLRVGIELEQVNAVSYDDARDQHRVLVNVFSKF
jgi:hypothetical protein